MPRDCVPIFKCQGCLVFHIEFKPNSNFAKSNLARTVQCTVQCTAHCTVYCTVYSVLTTVHCATNLCIKAESVSKGADVTVYVYETGPVFMRRFSLLVWRCTTVQCTSGVSSVPAWSVCAAVSGSGVWGAAVLPTHGLRSLRGRCHPHGPHRDRHLQVKLPVFS